MKSKSPSLTDFSQNQTYRGIEIENYSDSFHRSRGSDTVDHLGSWVALFTHTHTRGDTLSSHREKSLSPFTRFHPSAQHFISQRQTSAFHLPDSLPPPTLSFLFSFYSFISPCAPLSSCLRYQRNLVEGYSESDVACK